MATSNGKGLEGNQGNSFAASCVSLGLLTSQKDYSTKLEAMKHFDPNYNHVKIKKEFHILHTKAALFPLNKEMYSMINYSDMLQVDLVDVYDIKYSSNLNRELSNFKGNKKYIVKNIKKCEWERFDTLIIGHLRELSLLMRRNLKKKLLNLCLKYHKNVYCYDMLELDEYWELFREQGLILECADEYTTVYKDGRLYQLRTPVLSVLGTSKNQGKFTLQMQIKRILQDNKINLGVLGTEPNSILLGCDEMLPLGYDSQMASKPGKRIIESLNDKMHNIDVKSKDLILVGAKSGFYPQVTFNIGHINVDQFSFLFGTLPDGVILAIRDTDSIEYLEKSIQAIEKLGDTKVILLALYAFHTEKEYVIDVMKERLTDENINNIKSKLKATFGNDVIVSGDTRDDSIILSSIINHYCE